VPISTTVERRSQYAGAQGTFSVDRAKNRVQVGFYGFHQQDNQLVGLLFNDASNSNLSVREEPSGNLSAVFVQDTFSATSWLTLTGGVRQTHFAGGITENATSPRVGASIVIPSVQWVARGFYGHFYQPPPLITASGPLLDFVTAQNLGFIPLQGERDEEYQVGLTVPIRGWVVDVDRFRTQATNFFDHNPVGNSNVFFPVTIEGALIQGTEVTVRSPRTWTRGQVHLAYAYQTAQGHGAVNGGLTDFSSGGDAFPLDHDQRHTLSVGFDTRLPHEVIAAMTVYYGSGFPDEGGPAYLPGHTTFDVTLGKAWGKHTSLAVTLLNVTNNYLLIDNSLTFGGTHFNSPREVYAQLRYRFHY
jgi:outer membrane receptor for ferrienterochelin and colicin